MGALVTFGGSLLERSVAKSNLELEMQSAVRWAAELHVRDRSPNMERALREYAEYLSEHRSKHADALDLYLAGYAASIHAGTAARSDRLLAVAKELCDRSPRTDCEALLDELKRSCNPTQ